jgi:hypothetical protein
MWSDTWRTATRPGIGYCEAKNTGHAPIQVKAPITPIFKKFEYLKITRANKNSAGFSGST